MGRKRSAAAVAAGGPWRARRGAPLLPGRLPLRPAGPPELPGAPHGSGPASFPEHLQLRQPLVLVLLVLLVQALLLLVPAQAQEPAQVRVVRLLPWPLAVVSLIRMRSWVGGRGLSTPHWRWRLRL
jgi:hypothetical protein